MLAMIGRIFAPGFNRADPQGVQWDFLGSFSLLCGLEVGDMPVLRAFFERAVSAIILYVL